jgi:phosphoenolpyruvate---glycerone phosphotransferase subunit DhaL
VADRRPEAGWSPGLGRTVTEAWLRLAAARIHESREWLTQLDAAIGDGDHGINLDRGFAAVVADLDAGLVASDDAGAMLVAAGRRLLGIVGGASGALYGRGLMTAGERLRGQPAVADPDLRALATVALAGAIDGMVSLGHAVQGEKTMLDALVPALDAMRAAPPEADLREALRAAVVAAGAGATGTTPLVARKGRASYLGERSAGHLDPGAASSAILVECLADAVIGALGDGPEDAG